MNLHPGRVAQWPDTMACCLYYDCLCFHQRQDSGLRNILFESWADSLFPAGLRECFNLENRSGGCECGAYKTSGIFDGGLYSTLCLSSPEFSPNFFLPFSSEPLPSVYTPLTSAEGSHLLICCTISDHSLYAQSYFRCWDQREAPDF